MKKILKILLLVLIIVSFVSCTTKKTIKIGFMGTVSGASNDLSLGGLHGASLAIQEINNAGGINGRTIELIVKDTLNDKTIAKRVVDEFIREGIDIVIGEFTSSHMETVLDHDTNQKILFLSPTASSGIFNGKDDNMIRFIGDTDKQGVIITGQAKKNNHRNFIIIKDAVNRTYVDSTSAKFRADFEAVGGNIVYETLADYAAIIRSEDFMKEIMVSNPDADAILFLLDSVNTIILLQTMEDLGWDLGVYTSFWVNTGDFFKIGRQYIEGVHTVGFEEEGIVAGGISSFEDTYHRYFGTEASYPAFFGYDAVMALRDAIEETGTLRKKKIKEAIVSKGTYTGVAGNFVIDEFGDCSRQYRPMIVLDGEAVIFNLD